MATTTPPARHRHSIRLPHFNYAASGAYFLTVCTSARESLLGEIIGDSMRENAYGSVVREEWWRSADIRKEIELGAFVVMPNHIHGIVIIRDVPVHVTAVGATGRSPLPRTPAHADNVDRPRGPTSASLAAFVAGWKSAATKRINALREAPATPVWQRNYYEHIIRSEDEFRRIQAYIDDNPRRWPEDEENPDNWPPAAAHRRTT